MVSLYIYGNSNELVDVKCEQKEDNGFDNIVNGESNEGGVFTSDHDGDGDCDGDGDREEVKEEQEQERLWEDYDDEQDVFDDLFEYGSAPEYQDYSFD